MILVTRFGAAGDVTQREGIEECDPESEGRTAGSPADLVPLSLCLSVWAELVPNKRVAVDRAKMTRPISGDSVRSAGMKFEVSFKGRKRGPTK
jgi:hypothetical protein